ncbi:Prokaryotic cytochrome b561 [uncultured archaeon]|nr:Prokaryotic cytochrome b561 [uncultured archaeon]
MNDISCEEKIEEVIKEEKKIENLLKEEKKILRWPLVERFEHHTLILLTFVFIVTGLPILKIEWFSWLITPPNTIVTTHDAVDLFRLIHKAAAGIFVIMAIFHMSYHTLAVRRTRIKITSKDLTDTISLFKYYLGLTRDKPKLGFHNPTEKILVYWLMAVWFMAFMGVSGFVLMFPSYFSIWIHEWALVIHDVFFYLIVFMLIAHFYMTVLYKEYRPLLEGIFTTGLISPKFVREHHPLWYEEVKEKE